MIDLLQNLNFRIVANHRKNSKGFLRINGPLNPAREAREGEGKEEKCAGIIKIRGNHAPTIEEEVRNEMDNWEIEEIHDQVQQRGRIEKGSKQVIKLQNQQ